MGKMGELALAQGLPLSRKGRRHRAAPLAVPRGNGVNARVHLVPNQSHYMTFCLGGDGRDISMDQNQMAQMLELIREAQRLISIDDGRTDRQFPTCEPLGAGGRN